MVRFMSLSSGSSGNCYYIESPEGAILIDVGINIRNISHDLKLHNISMADKVKAVLLTHDHADHIRSIGHLSEKYGFPIYATEKVFKGIDHARYVINKPEVRLRNVVVPEKSFGVAGFEVTAFDIPHDASQNVGYYISGHGLSFTLLTDVGHITSTIRKYASKAIHLVVEANYDKEMLMFGSYPEFLKQRVSGPTGHLSNQETGEFLASVFRPEMENIWLCHLSKDNNHPELCWKTIENRLFNEGIRVGKDVTLTTLKRTQASPLYVLVP